MTKSTITRERLAKIKSWRETYGAGSNVMLPAEEAEELARMALAAMDSEPVAYIFKHPAGRLFWSLTDKSNKGHDDVMPVYASPQPAPIVEREPIAWLNDAYLARGVVDGEAGSEDAGPGYIPVYRHAQPAPVVPDEIKHRIGGLDWGWEGEFNRGWNACRAAMLQAEPVCTCPSGDGSLRWPCPVHPGSSPVIPDGYVMVPMRLTAENGAKGALSGEFSETKFVNCPECFGDDECETCDGSGRIEITVPVTWTTIKEIWAKGIEHFAAAPQSPGGDHATVPGKWIPVSERLPEDSGRYWCYVEEQNDLGKSHYQWNCSWNGDRWWVESEGGGIVTHWMPLPAAPQEVNRE
ncbi:TPA: DUF551 domain-containing protein [Klebsiella pneumoniae]|uniref:DUF551 domain-containing protein n=1 Tax=Klebsiella TaxID=570 RepID=UPI0004705012|nr:MULTISPECIES: DUF551 domain-containing protein [Klebsiella]MDF9986338.1 DUF551 domain-containing protein [Klebsiella pneumoniae]